MRNVTVIESAEELADAFAQRGETGPILPGNVSLRVGAFSAPWIDLTAKSYQIAPGITFEMLFVELCNRAGIKVKLEKR